MAFDSGNDSWVSLPTQDGRPSLFRMEESDVWLFGLPATGRNQNLKKRRNLSGKGKGKQKKPLIQRFCQLGIIYVGGKWGFLYNIKSGLGYWICLSIIINYYCAQYKSIIYYKCLPDTFPLSNFHFFLFLRSRAKGCTLRGENPRRGLRFD